MNRWPFGRGGSLSGASFNVSFGQRRRIRPAHGLPRAPAEPCGDDAAADESTAVTIVHWLQIPQNSQQYSWQFGEPQQQPFGSFDQQGTNQFGGGGRASAFAGPGMVATSAGGVGNSLHFNVKLKVSLTARVAEMRVSLM
ncbi:hypothetical protein BV898_15174 [Hypsibius exemplaris]|uniref:Uncharacterized protein n=1 Tax=Hypsibius exemplaris TaxID=2072580 RepID=A0A9X6NJS7_HYPEX|nr:hypothetical protein BV898_15174 [Hypsibius exemplaris]